jgi:DNA (cytosine-5)-methyltransferase 1
MTLTLGELFAGYGGLGRAVEQVFDAELRWYSEFDPAPSAIMAHHWPGAPNLGDITKIHWPSVEPVDIISGGSPCQDLSAAGRRRGMTEGTRSNLWAQMREAIAVIRPRYVVWENVRGAYSATAISDLEPCPGCMGDTGNGKPALRAFGRVLGDLADIGYDCQWRGLRAADVGAPHGRFRVFILARRRERTPATTANAPRRGSGRGYGVPGDV